MHEAHGDEIGGGERLFAGEEFVGDAAKSVLIAFPADFATELFGGHVGWGAYDGGQLDAHGAEHSGNAKICQLDFVVARKENVFGFEIAVNYLLLVGILQGVCHLRKNADGFVLRERPPLLTLDTIAQRAIGRELGNEVGKAFMNTDVDDG